ncbi:MAG: LutB/LldF family L-lactate oxidation iron-sulfur protein [Ardenticatenaceae bacterium]|nr:LutB/LldF family L-lactate oxidation iron-sulfur protein [Ardenticatenaceae bacterium]
MTATVREFTSRAKVAIADPRLQSAIEGATNHFRQGREQALAALPNAGALRDHTKAMRAATLARLDEHLDTFARNARAAGAEVHFAADGHEANRIVLEIARRHGITLAVKSKSMATEETHLNRTLEEAGITTVETDLGEWIIQLAGETPSHIIGPAIHKTREQVAELLSLAAGQPLPTDVPVLTATARRLLRERFLAAGMGISGGNIAIAESGTVVLVTNEGNGRLVTSAPPVHVAVVGIEKIVPTWNDAAAVLALLARSATGQPLSIYTSFVTGPARPGDPDGPREVHIVFLDNRRSAQLGTKYAEALQCIRCGACLNVCPVYREAGGHAYGSPYSGPIGAVITPLLSGLAEYSALPHASTLCGACLDACPVRIDLPRMLLELRADEVATGEAGPIERLIFKATALLMGHARLWGLGPRLAARLQAPFQRDRTLHLPVESAAGRPLPALATRSFHERWKEINRDA